MTLEMSVAQSVAAVRLLERALHEPTGWTMQWGGIEVPVERTVHPWGVVLTAFFPDACWITPDQPPLCLLHNGDLLAVRPMETPGDGPFTVDWSLAAETATVTA